MYVCGIDVSKNTLDLCFYSKDKVHYRKVNNDSSGFQEFESLINFLSVQKIGYEATGNYAKKFHSFLSSIDRKAFVFAPVKIANFRRSQNVHGKTDISDSFIIAKYLFQDNEINDYVYPVRDAMGPYTTTLALLTKQHNQLSNLIHSIELFPDSPRVLAHLFSLLDELTLHKTKIEDEAIDFLYQLAPESKKVRNDIKGVGDKLILHVIPHLYDHFDKFTLKQINAFFGLNPVEFESGVSVKRKPKISHGGDALIKKHLYMSSISAVRNNEILREKYLRLKESGKPSKVALVAVMAQLLRAIVSRLSHHTGRPIKK